MTIHHEHHHAEPSGTRVEREKSLALEAAPAAPQPAGTEWVCPMHPEIVRDAPGSCPLCGMALEPRTVLGEQAPNPERLDMRRRFWIKRRARDPDDAPLDAGYGLAPGTRA